MKRAPKASLALVGASAAIVALHEVLVRAMAHGHVAHVLLGAGNAAPPLGAALLAVALVGVRLLAMVVVPGVLGIAAVGFARYLVGSYSIGTSESDGAGTGTSIGDGGTV